ncbi:hypothetical protein CFAM422_009058 [Trichoderma lentiforme]|uniref:Uncharacterized protein n=1 Tax=Trichoderma lentiforme TaxID=1567552 RepID=A0A9P4XAG1_9HYPO|nr:hypothetical protein CFAM422_009058 [Trichoderma lentiforme]
MLSYALLGIIINHPSPAPPLHQQRCLSLCGAVLCCAVPSPLPPSAARLLSSRLVWFGFGLVMVPFGMLPVWLGRTAGLGLVSALWCVWASFVLQEVEIVWMEYHGVAVSNHGDVFFDECTG